MKKIMRNIINILRFYDRKDIFIGKNVALNGSVFEGKNRINNNTVLVNCYIGRGTYVGPNGDFFHTTIGRYCSIGTGVKMKIWTHPVNDYVSTHPSFFSLTKQAGFTYTHKQRFNERILLDELSGISVEIGNDVWIGDDVSIMGGIKIGDGAIIGTKALVTADVAPYTVVGGIPAKKIKNRFEENEIAFLLKFKWWEKDEEWIIENNEFFLDIKMFVEQFGG